MRHVLEHNPDWDIILDNALASFRKRFALVLFTPFSEETHPLDDGGLHDLSFRREDITDRFPSGCSYSEEHISPSDTQYGEEHVFYLEKAEIAAWQAKFKRLAPIPPVPVSESEIREGPAPEPRFWKYRVC